MKNRQNMDHKLFLGKILASEEDIARFHITSHLRDLKMDEKLKNAAPFNLFLTSVASAKETKVDPLSVTFQELLDDKLGEIQSSLQINYVVNFKWLMEQYGAVDLASKPMLVLHGRDPDDLDAFQLMEHPNVTAIKVKTPEYGTHHTKMMVFAYKDNSIRLVISTANLYEADWENRTQGVWISPKLLPMTSQAQNWRSQETGDSKTQFKQSLTKYLDTYNILELQFWINRIKSCDFKPINVFFVASVPGHHRIEKYGGGNWGHLRMHSLLQKYCASAEMDTCLIAQCSSIGFLGPDIDAWIASDFAKSMSQAIIQNVEDTEFKLVYPSLANITESYDGIEGADCFPYTADMNDTQPWLKDYLYQWKSCARNRTRAAPHLKSYARCTDSKISWFCLSSANLSKAAWGRSCKNQKGKVLAIKNYEAGILFLPNFVSEDEELTFDVAKFPLPYDLPLVKYDASDEPFMRDAVAACKPENIE